MTVKAAANIGFLLWGLFVALGVLNMTLFMRGLEAADRTNAGGAFSPLEGLLSGVWAVLAAVTVAYTCWFAWRKFARRAS